MTRDSYLDLLNTIKGSGQNVLEQANSLLRKLEEVSSDSIVSGLSLLIDMTTLMGENLANISSMSQPSEIYSVDGLSQDYLDDFTDYINQVEEAETPLNLTGNKNWIAFEADEVEEDYIYGFFVLYGFVNSVKTKFAEIGVRLQQDASLPSNESVSLAFQRVYIPNSSPLQDTEEALDSYMSTMRDCITGAGFMSDIRRVLLAAINGFTQNGYSGSTASDSIGSVLSIINDSVESNGIRAAVSTALQECMYLPLKIKDNFLAVTSQGLTGIISYVKSLFDDLQNSIKKYDSDSSEGYFTSDTTITVRTFAGGLVLGTISTAINIVAVTLLAVNKIVGAIALVVSTVANGVIRMIASIATDYNSTRFTIHSGRCVNSAFSFCLDQTTFNTLVDIDTDIPLLDMMLEHGWSIATVEDRKFPLVYFVSLSEIFDDVHGAGYQMIIETHLSSCYDLAHISRLPTASDYYYVSSLMTYYPNDCLISVTEFTTDQGENCSILWANGACNNGQIIQNKLQVGTIGRGVYAGNLLEFSNGLSAIMLPTLMHSRIGVNTSPDGEVLLKAARSVLDIDMIARVKDFFNDELQAAITNRLFSSLALLYYCLCDYCNISSATGFGAITMPATSDESSTYGAFFHVLQLGVAGLQVLPWNIDVPQPGIFDCTEHIPYASNVDALISHIAYAFSNIRYKTEAATTSNINLASYTWASDGAYIFGQFGNVSSSMNNRLKRMADIIITKGCSLPWLPPYSAVDDYRDFDDTDIDFYEEGIVNCWPSALAFDLPTLTFDGYMKGLVVDGLIVAAGIITAAVAAYFVVKLRNKQAQLQADAESKWYAFQDAESDADKMTAWKSYKTARLKNNLLATFTGGTKLGLGLYDDTSESTGIISTISNFISEKVNGDDSSITLSDIITLIHG